MIPYGKQDINQADIDAVTAVLKSDFLTQGPQVPAFEKAVAAHTNAAYAVAVNSATSALHIGCLALGLKSGDSLWTTPNSFVASANCGLYCGAKVDFVDIDPATYNLCPEQLKAKLATAKQPPKVLVVVHFGGEPCDMEAIAALAKQYKFQVIEDASHAIGGRYQDQPIGNCQYSALTVFSFHPVKIVTTAEGGVITTRSKEVAERLGELRSHGITRNPERMTKAPDGPWYYQQIELGLNYRMTELQAALGCSQLQRLDEFVARRQQLADQYDELLAGLPVRSQQRNGNNYSALHLYVVEVPATSRRAVFESLREQGIGVNVHYIPIHTQPYYQGVGFREGDFPAAEHYYSGAISLPLYATLTDAEQQEVVAALRHALTEHAS
ncbi:UDP-4-amino-4,6-dideoxy-N-acetyl-beta-L-altrosamine transaminase [Pseudidiomarina planktonica]|uniref:UDP-4-amino-4,6-dideoxy-N-acetyl-beta-L-altrosamine transaminase n=1 Tax=Pseudidiomarina planktonica TaxID=1323738 RepID=A0A1Y6EI74_9GAMM|nr:UDP-4-amino-4,6-dideoxy-N-acetyl-beta-L-altrosamine transaminase [Pseudidiomarina planktonica]RUO65849.1 UDP-4-amino-4,6-dideoxy-N-acetyl-beta-L-altrosamine transaminase [Pseudidiomarina planktonica]SMQ62315.1 UDP-4-amino-4,6-dideoxy-N-acetyl-beta-L-altrosamine transaminase [Pseudidiomarina planktonica]